MRATFASDPREVRGADAVILPGDGAFGATMQALRERGLDAALKDVIDSGRALLGICVGMQLLFESSTEFGGESGFGVLHGRVDRFTGAPRVPHVGWNRLEIVALHPLVEGIEDGAYVYFLHSYCAPVGVETVAATTHGQRFAAVVAAGNVMGTQFHPEKSQRTGAMVLDNFIALAKRAR